MSKIGAGIATLSGTNTYSGGTTVSAGTLTLGSATALPAGGNLTVNTGGTLNLNNFNSSVGNLSGTGGAITMGTANLAINQVGAGTYAGIISGTGSLTKNGASTLSLTGANTYSGITTVSAGSLQVGDGGTIGTLGTGGVINNANLTFNRSDALTVGNDISGTGSLTKLGAGTTTLTGANTYSGTTTVSAGSLQVGDGGTIGTLGTGSVLNNANLIFNRSDDLALNNLISGSGALAQNGAGTLFLNGMSSYTGATAVNSGALRVNGSIASSSLTTVASGALLGGNGNVGNLLVQAGGFIAPGNSIGTLTVNGNYTQAGIYQLEYRALPLGLSSGRNTLEGASLADQDADLIHVTGSANLSGGSVVLLPQSTTTEFTDSLNASPTNQLRYLVLRADGGRNGTEFVALSNGAAALEYPNSDDVELVMTGTQPVIITSTAPSGLAAADQGLWQLAVDNLAYQRPMCNERAGQLVSGRCGFVQDSYWNSSRADTPSTDTHAPGGMLGAGFAATDDLWLGVSVGGSDATLTNSATENASSLSSSGFVWGQWRPGDLDLRGWLGAAYHDVNSRRQTLLGSRANVDFHAWQGIAAIEARWWQPAQNGLRITPLLGLQATQVRRSSYNEGTASIDNFKAEAQDQSSVQSALGGELEWNTAMGKWPAMLTGSLVWQHEYQPTDTTLKGTYAGDTTRTELGYDTTRLPENQWRAGAGASVALSEAATLQLLYTGGFATDDVSSNSNALTARYSFAW